MSEDEDDLLLVSLRRIASQVDPIPDLLTRAGYAALSTRRLDAELAELVLDSRMVEAGGLRAADDGVRVLSFVAPTWSVELEVQRADGRVLLRGVVSGSRGDIVVQGSQDEWPAVVDGDGFFQCPDLPAGPLRVRSAEAGIVTPWFIP